MGREVIIRALQAAMPELGQRFGVRHLLLFGSFARGTARPDSDVDLLAEFDRPISLMGLGSLRAYLEKLLGRSVDVGPLDSLRASARDEVARGGVACRVGIGDNVSTLFLTL